MRFQKSFRVLSALALGLQLQACSKAGDSSSASSPAANQETISCDTATGYKNYFEDVNSAADTAAPIEAGILRQRKVKVDLSSLKADILKGSSRLHLDLFQDRPVDVVVEKIQKTSGEGAVVSGHLKDDPLSSVALAIEKDVVIANINPMQSTHYKIVYAGNGVHTIQEANDMDGENESSCLAESALAAPPENNEHTAQDVTPDESNQAVAATPVIDMLVTYTPSAVSGAGSESAIKALIETGIANTNKAFTDSGVNLKVRLVGTMALTQNESGNWSSDLSALSSKTDGKWDAVHAERARLGADQVTVVGEFLGSSVAGIGFIKSASGTAFTVVKRSAFSQYTFSHELGHNIGLQHSDGYVNSSAGFRTIMAYGSVPRILRYSNPSIAYKSYATGSSASNSAAILNANGSATASLVATKVADTVTEVPVVPPSTPASPGTSDAPGTPSGNCGSN